MPLSPSYSLLLILLVGAVTFSTRLLPFLLFPKGKEIPPIIRYLGDALTPAIIGMLVVYCLKSTTFTKAPFGIPEIISVAVTAVLHTWKENVFLSIGCGTVLYMFLIQVVF